MQQRVYHSREIQAWEQRWFEQQNSSYGLMQQVAWRIAEQLQPSFQALNMKHIAVCCGQGNNAGDGYLIAKYLHQAGLHVDIYAAELGPSSDLAQAAREARQQNIRIFSNFDFQHDYDVYIDALFGIGLNRDLDTAWQAVIARINQQSALKIAIDIPSGLNANTGQAMPIAIEADRTFTALALKAGLFTGQGKAYCGEVETISIVPRDAELTALAQLTDTTVGLPKRKAYGHKGSYGHVLVIGGHADMGGAVIMAAEAAFSSGAGKVTVVCDAKHHTAILARAPNIMLKDINTLNATQRKSLIAQVDALCFGMGLGRDAWAEQQYQGWAELIQAAQITTVYDADALWFLAQYPQTLHAEVYCTPHPGEAATLLGIKTSEIESDRVQAIYALQQKYHGQWVLKGAGSLSLTDQLFICRAGNPGMGTGGMGDVLAGMIASLKAQFDHILRLDEMVMLHALAGDELAKQGERGLQAQDMKHAIYKVINASLN